MIGALFILLLAVTTIIILLLPKERSRKKECAAFNREYNLSRPGDMILDRVYMIYPSWLAAKDRQTTKDCVHSYIKHFPQNRYCIFLHDYVGDSIVGPEGWARGWRTKRVIFVPWRKLLDGSPARFDPFPTLPYHVSSLLCCYDNPDAFRRIRMGASRVLLSDESIEAAKSFRYIPWKKTTE